MSSGYGYDPIEIPETRCYETEDDMMQREVDERRDFNKEQALTAVVLAHLLELAVSGSDERVWKDRARTALAEYKASRAAERDAVAKTSADDQAWAPRRRVQT